MRKKLLLADDSVTIQKVVSLIFANGEYDLQCVSNGDAAFEKISFERPDIVLADVNMPGKNGFELCSAIKNNPASSAVPVLLLVGSFEPFDEDQARSAGADGWIIKPFESQDLIDEVEGLLSRPAEAVSWPEPGGTAGAAEPDMWADMELDNLDMESAGDTGTLVETFDGVPQGGGIELEEENLWEEDEQPMAGEPQPGAASAVDEEGFAGEDDILFIDEDDLLDDEPEQIAVSAFAEVETLAVEPETVSTEPETVSTEPDTVSTEPDTVSTEPDAPSGDSLPAGPAMEIPSETAEWFAAGEAQPAVEAPSQPVPEKGGLDYWRNDGLITRLATPADQLLAEAETPPPAAEPVEAVAPSMEESAGPGEEEVVARVQALSEEDLGRIVERVAGTVIERLAGSILEKIAWEVVPDLAEGLIKEEIRKITETSR